MNLWTRPISSSIRMEQNIEPPVAAFVQAIPIYMASDAAVFQYFKDYKRDIDAITGDALVIAMPIAVEAGDASVVASIFSPGVMGKRYPGLLRSDLPCFWLEDAQGGHAIIRLPSRLEDLNSYVRAMTDAAQAVNTPAQMKQWVHDRLKLDTQERSSLMRALAAELPMAKSTERLIALACGVIFVAAILTLAVFIPTPSPFQYQVFRIVLALAAAGFVSMTPGFLQVTISTWMRAGGALAVFVIVYFYNPATLVLP